ncbi:hypothetical protein SAMN05660489_05840 [Pseudomonas sp. LAMO17WK12:I10]|uniref:NleF caspase inhibitor n=1 Tax=unclassified Pseudomonas TaxID=196821 RepID=UPI000BD3F240|nr:MULTISPECIES: NleF caspase inhibitor [unclassified Pseudomonas]PXX54010.1 hypothetical protein H160_05833 [Pseudomonas sp. LAMO17WK12:I9]SNY51952.1 hypothetical protein SAMN05660489_05840 [Pseudomonas sp. LAMO17WK12:I10]
MDQTLDSSSLISEARKNIDLAKAALNQATSEYNNLMAILQVLREDTFEYVNPGTNYVTGKLADGMSTEDRDTYIEKLVEFNTLRTELQKLSDENSFFNMSTLTYIHHSSSVFGDLQSLNAGHPVPDFSYNNKP